MQESRRKITIRMIIQRIEKRKRMIMMKNLMMMLRKMRMRQEIKIRKNKMTKMLIMMKAHPL